MNNIPEVLPVTELRNNAKLCADIVTAGKDVILTKNGRGTMILIDLDKYSELIEDMRLQKAIITGEQQISEGKIKPWSEAKESIRKAIQNA